MPFLKNLKNLENLKNVSKKNCLHFSWLFSKNLKNLENLKNLKNVSTKNCLHLSWLFQKSQKSQKCVRKNCLHFSWKNIGFIILSVRFHHWPFNSALFLYNLISCSLLHWHWFLAYLLLFSICSKCQFMFLPESIFHYFVQHIYGKYP